MDKLTFLSLSLSAMYFMSLDVLDFSLLSSFWLARCLLLPGHHRIDIELKLLPIAFETPKGQLQACTVLKADKRMTKMLVLHRCQIELAVTR